MDIIMTIIQVFAQLAEYLGVAYERRPQQEELSEAIAKSLSDNITLMAKAPTGVGKSFAYLIPAILEIQANREAFEQEESKLITGEHITFVPKRVVVTTANTALQDQLANKDLPTLHKAMGGFTYAILKGRERYICLNKADGVELPGIQEVLDRIEEMIGTEGFTGEFDQLNLNVDPLLKRAVTSDEDSCDECFDGCFYVEAREEAKKADILVVNHSLWIKDLFIRSVNPVARLLGSYDHVIVDEAHQLEDFGTNALGDKISVRTIEGAMKAVIRLSNMMPAGIKADIEEKVRAVRDEATSFFSSLRPPKAGMANWRLKKVDIDATNLADLHNTLNALRKALPIGIVDMVGVQHRKQAKKFYDRASSRVKTQLFRCKTIGVSPWLGLDGNVRVVEMEYGQPALHYKPISIAGFMRKNYFDLGLSAVFVSATLPFDYIGKRLGVPTNTRALAVGSPFPFKECGLLYVPKDMPDPKKQPNERPQAVADRILELVQASRGRALLLFTSRQQMDAVYDILRGKIDQPVLKQGEMPNGALQKAFRDNIDSVLFGLKSFMTGVDFDGETCSLVVIDKMPFPILGDPLVEARMETIELETGDKWASYDGYMVPEMVIALDQAMGRLIRRTTDRGVVAILDPRLRSQKNDWIFDELPPFRTVGGLKTIREFFA